MEDITNNTSLYWDFFFFSKVLFNLKIKSNACQFNINFVFSRRRPCSG